MIKFLKGFKENWRLSKINSVLELASIGLALGFLIKGQLMESAFGFLIATITLGEFSEINMKKDINELRDKVKELEK